MRLISGFIVWGLAAAGAGTGFGASQVLTLDPDFEVRLMAAEGLAGSPLDLDWDTKARLWATIGSPDPGIFLLEDSNGDGVFEERRPYYRGEVSSLVFHAGGVIAAGGSRILFIEGEGKVRPLFSGFARPGAEGGGVEIRLECQGLDGWVYGVLDHDGGTVGPVVGGEGRDHGVIGRGIIRFRPDGSAIESVAVFRERVGGLDFTWDGELFFSAESHLNQLILTEAELGVGRMEQATGWKSIGDHGRDYPRWEAGTGLLEGVTLGPGGCAVYEGGAWPEEFHGNYFVAEPALHSVHEDIISVVEGQTDYLAVRRRETDFVKGDASFWPTGLKVGPDGALYILDSFAPVERHGRIWRVQHKRARNLGIPDFAVGGVSAWVRHLAHPNRWVRETAQRLLAGQKNNPAVVETLRSEGGTTRLAPFRVHALWSLQALGGVDEATILNSVGDPRWGVQKNALRILGEGSDLITTPVEAQVILQLESVSKRVRLGAISVLGRTSLGDEVLKKLAGFAADERQVWGQSLVAGIGRRVPLEFGKLAMESTKPDRFRDLMPVLVDEMVAKGREEDVAQLIVAAAARSEAKDPLKAALLRAVNPHLGRGFTPTWSGEFEEAMEGLLEARTRSVRVAALPLAFHYPSEEGLVREGEKVLDEVLRRLKDDGASAAEREELLRGLMAVWRMESRVIGLLGGLIESDASSEVKELVIRDMGAATSDEVAAVLISAYPKLAPELREAALSVLLERRSWTMALLEAVEGKRILVGDLGLAGLDRLRHHPDGDVARSGRSLFQQRTRGVAGDAELMRARFEPVLQDPPDVDEGRDGFEEHCAACHRPGRRGLGAGPRLEDLKQRRAPEILAQIIDPNRRVEDRFKAVRVTTREGGHHYGVIVREDREGVVLRDFGGTVVLKRSEIAALEPTGRSYMPEGLPVLGAEMLRDIIGYLQERPSQEYRMIDLTGLATVDSRRPVQHPLVPLLDFAGFGVVEVSGEPYLLPDPAGLAGGRNVVMLKGGEGAARLLPQRVEIPLNVKVDELFLLGAVAAWGFPHGSPLLHQVPAVRVVMHYADGGREELVLRNGEEIADVAGPVDVPGSRAAAGLVYQGQLRRLSIEPKQKSLMRSIVLESYDNHLAPLFVALTVKLEE